MAVLQKSIGEHLADDTRANHGDLLHGSLL
jgi:hypothetical protein